MDRPGLPRLLPQKKTADLADEIAVFSSKSGFEALAPLLDRMLELRNSYQQDPRFIPSTLRSLPRFHHLALQRNRFPHPSRLNTESPWKQTKRQARTHIKPN